MKTTKNVVMKGYLRIERGDRTRIISLDVDLKRNPNRALQLVGCKVLVIGEDTFPIERLRLSPATKAKLILSGINTLSAIPKDIDILRTLLLDDEELRELLNGLRVFGYVLEGGKKLQWRKDARDKAGQGWLIDAFLSKPVKELGMSPQIWIKLSSRGIQTIKQLCECTEGFLKNITYYAEDIKRRLMLRLKLDEDEISEIIERLDYYGLCLKDTSTEKTGRWAELWQEDLKLLKARATNRVSLEEAKRILRDQYDLFLGLREAKSVAERLAWRNAIVMRNLGWVAKAVSYLVPEMIRQDDPCMDFDDLFQEGAIGIMRGISLYDMTSGYTLTTYLTHWIRHMARRFIQETAGIPVHRQDALARLRKAYKILGLEGNLEPSIDDLAKVMKVTPEEVEKLLILIQIGFDKHCKTLDFVTDEDDIAVGEKVPSDFPELPDLIADADQNLALKEAVAEVLDTASLLPIEREILELRFGLKDGQEHTLEAIGEKYGVTHERIRQREENALERLRTLDVFKRVKGLVTRLLSPSVAINDALWLDALDVWKFLLEARQDSWIPQNVLENVALFFQLEPKKVLKEASEGRRAVAQYIFVSFCLNELGLSSEKIAESLGYPSRRIERMFQEVLAKFDERGYRIEKGKLASVTVKEDLLLSPESLGQSLLGGIDEILKTVASHHGILVDELKPSAGRYEKYIEARFEAIYLLRKKLKLSFSNIAQILGYKDHAAVIYAYQKFKVLQKEKGKDAL